MQRIASFLIALALAGGLFLSKAQAQGLVTTTPLTTTVSQGSSFILTTNTFQRIFPAAEGQRGRVGCMVQNVGTNAMFVYFGATTAATTAKSVRLPQNATVFCQQSGMTIRDAVNITGTATEQFFAIAQ
jgi:hypothetical protein